MIYLFSQIIISLSLAAIVGGSVGWLLHRSRAGRQIKQLESVVSRQQHHVSEAQTQVSLLTGDFDDLKHKSETEIASLNYDNQKIPALNQNLEKSQLLVRQLMQQHKAESVELTSENKKLTAKVKLANDREQAFTKLQAALDLERRRNQQLTAKIESADGQAANSADGKAANSKSNSKDAQSELPVSDKNENTLAQASSDLAAAESTTGDTTATSSTNEQAVKATNQSHSEDAAQTIEPAQKPHKKLDLTTATKAETEAELKLLRDQLAENVPKKDTFKAVPLSARVRTPVETAVEKEDEGETSFDSVAQHDDLKQIFGIGPVTEKTLNKLGITAYAQLAELKQHDIEKIADALQISSSRIERDNWVGSARSQLEAVLEDL